MKRDFRSFSRFFVYLFASVLAGGCGIDPVNHNPVPDSDSPIKHVIFFDGTSNDEASHTNVSKLHKLITLQSRTDIRTSYIPGVGTSAKIIGMAAGWGIGHDVRQAYSFLLGRYNRKRGDKVYIFGFSRGAYAARIYAALLHLAGIPNVDGLSSKDKQLYIEELYKAYKTKESFKVRTERVRAAVGGDTESTRVAFMGLWDTVEALGIPDYDENTKIPNPRYADQLCNIDAAAHALAIDDDRARIFTPILLTHDHLVENCTDVVPENIVDEVWFSGAHSDVGGGYRDTDIDGVSLNWMLRKIKELDLVPENAAVYEDILGKTHNPHSGIFRLVYKEANRSIDTYYGDDRLKIHRSVLERLSVRSPKAYEYQWLESEKYADCFYELEEGLIYIEEQDCFDIVEQ